MTTIEILQEALDEQLQLFEIAKYEKNYLELANVSDKIAKLSYAIFLIQGHTPNE